ncbi:MAG: glycosyltransferase, partial [Candidatus Paceibacterota bacterium]
MKKLSIIIPVFNEKQTILKLLDHVCAASTPDLEKEIIIVDDFSTDGTKDILKTLPKDKYKVVYHDVN